MAIAIPAPTGGFHPAGALDATEQHGIITLLLMPVSLHMLVEHPSFASRRLGSLVLVLLGADFTKNRLAKAQLCFPSTTVSAANRMTETAGPVRWPFHGVSLEEAPYFGGIAAIGIPAPETRSPTRDAISGAVLSREETDELCFCSPATIKQCLLNTNADTFFMVNSGRWRSRTGDFPIVDKDGFFFVLGRISVVTKRGELSVTAAALEDYVSDFVSWIESSVGVPHPALGQVPFAIVYELRENQQRISKLTV